MNIKKIISIILLSFVFITCVSINNIATDLENDNSVIEDSDNNKDNSTDTDNDYNSNDNNENESTNSNNSSDSSDSSNTDGNDTSDDSNDGSEINNDNLQENNSNQEQKNEPISSGSSGNSGTKSNASINNNANKSKNANLKSLDVDADNLSPEFDENVTDYYLIIGLDIEEVDVDAVPEDKNAKVTIAGNTNLSEGENTIKIVVTAEAGNTKTYNIHVTKTDNIEEVNANLKNLSVKDFSLYPNFKSNIYNYNLTVNKKISKLEILAETELEEAKYEIIGNENLSEGDNLIKIVVTAKDGQTQREYKINVYMSSGEIQSQETNIMPAIIILSVIGVLIVGAVIGILKKNNVI